MSETPKLHEVSDPSKVLGHPDNKGLAMLEAARRAQPVFGKDQPLSDGQTSEGLIDGVPEHLKGAVDSNQVTTAEGDERVATLIDKVPPSQVQVGRAAGEAALRDTAEPPSNQ